MIMDLKDLSDFPTKTEQRQFNLEKRVLRLLSPFQVGDATDPYNVVADLCGSERYFSIPQFSPGRVHCRYISVSFVGILNKGIDNALLRSWREAVNLTSPYACYLCFRKTYSPHVFIVASVDSLLVKPESYLTTTVDDQQVVILSLQRLVSTMLKEVS